MPVGIFLHTQKQENKQNTKGLVMRMSLLAENSWSKALISKNSIKSHLSSFSKTRAFVYASFGANDGERSLFREITNCEHILPFVKIQKRTLVIAGSAAVDECT